MRNPFEGRVGRPMAWALVVSLWATAAWAGGTALKGSVVSFLPYCELADVCSAGHCAETGAPCVDNGDCHLCTSVGREVECSSNMDCFFGGVSSKSKFMITGTGNLKMVIKEAVNPIAQLITTDGTIGTADDFIAHVVALGSGANFISMFAKVELKNGKGKVDVDVSGLLPADGEFLLVYFAALRTPPAVPEDCPGGNSPADLAARAGDPDCETGDVIAAMGLVSGS